MIRLGEIRDIDALVELMGEFYAESGYELNRARAAEAFAEILKDPRLGFVWLIEADGVCAGHVVVTVRYAMEFGGLLACVDDLYVRPAFRNRGLSTGALRDVVDFCRTRDMRAMSVEVGLHNEAALKVYRRTGFAVSEDRQLLALTLAPPTHVT